MDALSQLRNLMSNKLRRHTVNSTKKYDLIPANFEAIEALAKEEKKRLIEHHDAPPAVGETWAWDNVGRLCIIPPCTGRELAEWYAGAKKEREEAARTNGNGSGAMVETASTLNRTATGITWETVSDLPRHQHGEDRFSGSEDFTLIVQGMQVGQTVKIGPIPANRVRSFQSRLSRIVYKELHWSRANGQIPYMTVTETMNGKPIVHDKSYKDNTEPAYLYVKRLG